eukprot:11412911-Karenia_brevis.AAC.1
MGGSETHMALLDWEKAFDRVYHDKLFESLRRCRIPEKMVKVIQSLYENPTFEVEINGIKSTKNRQQRGIRQGCPLSPYLFVILMTTLFHDVRRDGPERTDKPDGVEFTEVLYADDTILLGKDIGQIQQTLHKIEEHSKTFGLALNKDKCIHL